MKLGRLAILAIVLMFSAAATSANSDMVDVSVEARAIIQAGSENVVELLVELGASSAEAAGSVLVVVATESPRLLEETIQGLATVLSEAELQRALNLAANALQKIPGMSDVFSKAIEVFDCASVDQCAERINEVPGNFEDGSDDPVDPPASPA